MTDDWPLYEKHHYICDGCGRKVEAMKYEGLPMFWLKDRPEKFCSTKCADLFKP